MSWTIRQATPADAPTIVEFNRRLAEESEGMALDPAVLAAGVAAALAYPDAKGPNFLAVEGDTSLDHGAVGQDAEQGEHRHRLPAPALARDAEHLALLDPVVHTVDDGEQPACRRQPHA